MIRPVLCAWLLQVAVMLSPSAPAHAFTPAEADTAFKAFNQAFYSVSNGKGYYRKETTGGRSDFWMQAEQIEMIVDAFERTHDPAHQALISESIAGFTDRRGTNWLRNSYNDDILWMVIACARAYGATSNATFKGLAKFHFDAVYNRAWDSALGGGMYWRTNNTSKNACVNGPAAIAACLLYEIYREPAYLAKAQALFAWEKSTLVDPASGAVSDHIRTNGVVSPMCLTYNQGTFIGAANYLYKQTGNHTYYEAALQSARYTRTNLCAGNILPVYRDGDRAGFNGILVRWLARFAQDQQLWSEFHPWLLENAETAWRVRRADNLSWHRWLTPTPDGALNSWSCSDTVVILQVVPPKAP